MQLFHVPTLGEDIGHLIQGAIDGHQLQTEGKGSLGLWSSERPATLSEALTHHHGSQALLPCGQRNPGGQTEAMVWPNPAQAPTQMGKDLRHIGPVSRRAGPTWSAFPPSG